nr:ABC transporter permease [uncultured Mobiluncus sp.]
MSVKTKDGFVLPGQSRGLLGALSQNYLLSLLVHKELRVRYRGSFLGMLWSYVKPATQFLVFYFAIGVFMGMNRNITNYVVYMFSGVVIINYFSEIFGNATRILVGNSDLVKKIYMPRELFPLSSVVVAFIHFFPQIVIMIIGALFFGWKPQPVAFLALILGIIITTILALGLGLIFGALNVLYRDSENFVDLILMMATWISPVLYLWSMVHNVFSGSWEWLWHLYLLNPMTIAVELMHKAFWEPTNGVGAGQVLPNLGPWTLVALGISFVILIIGNAVFKHFESKFAQEL